jgi:hypothetical protein
VVGGLAAALSAAVDFAGGVIRVRHCLKVMPGPDGHGVLQLYRHQIADKVSAAAAAMDGILGRVSGS